MANTAELLFQYLKDVLYKPDAANLDISSLDEEYQKLGMGLLTFAQYVKESSNFAKALAKGDLEIPETSRTNELVAPLKSLYANLRHMTWQTQQVAKGDYQQRMDFLGEFSVAFNTMIEQLAARQQALEKEIAAGQQKAAALAASNRLLTSVTSNLPQIILVVDRATKEVLFYNAAAAPFLPQSQLLTKTLGAIHHLDYHENEFTISNQNILSHYALSAYPLQWDGVDATACVIQDITHDKAQFLALQQQAFRDSLTSLHNRYYGMQQMNEWLQQGTPFVLCFVDLDNLKYVNDNYGHQEGDDYITKAASLLSNFSANSVACRLGGDEFMVLCPDLTEQEAFCRVEELCCLLREEVKMAQKDYFVNMSYGIVFADPQLGISASSLLSQADERMYEHKRIQKKERLQQNEE